MELNSKSSTVAFFPVVLEYFVDNNNTSTSDEPEVSDPTKVLFSPIGTPSKTNTPALKYNF